MNKYLSFVHLFKCLVTVSEAIITKSTYFDCFKVIRDTVCRSEDKLWRYEWSTAQFITTERSREPWISTSSDIWTTRYLFNGTRWIVREQKQYQRVFTDKTRILNKQIRRERERMHEMVMIVGLLFFALPSYCRLTNSLSAIKEGISLSSRMAGFVTLPLASFSQLRNMVNVRGVIFISDLN